MGILPIRIAGDPVLREKAKRVRTIDASIQKLIDDMIETMHSAPGVGLAAPQVGVPIDPLGLGTATVRVPDSPFKMRDRKDRTETTRDNASR